jgi:hypothetical protein
VTANDDRPSPDHDPSSAFAADLPVDVLGLSAGLCGTLRRWGYGRIGALTQATRSELLDVPGVGPRRVSDIEAALGRFDLALQEERLDVRRAHPLAAPVMDALIAGEGEESVADEIGVPIAAVRAWRVGCRPTERQTGCIRVWAAERSRCRSRESSTR